METLTVLVAHASGLLGSEICRLLSAKNLTLKAMVRETIDQGELTSVKVFANTIVKAEPSIADGIISPSANFDCIKFY